MWKKLLLALMLISIAPLAVAMPAYGAATSGVYITTTPYPSTYGSLSSIARALCGNVNKYPDIARANGIKNPDLIGTGVRLYIPCATSTTTATRAVQPPASGWTRPLVHYSSSSCFGMRFLKQEGYWRMHYGVDMSAPYGTPVKAAAAGTVTEVDAHSGYGISVTISHGNNVRSFYAHMSKRLVWKGKQVKVGDVIGRVGSTGYSFGNHLHFGMHYGPGSGYRDSNPIPFLRARGVSITCG